MTERVEVHFDWGEPSDVDAQMKAAIAAAARTSFRQISQQITKIAKNILSEADLPVDPESLYVVDPVRGWGVTTGPEGIPVNFAVIKCGYAPDSEEASAALALMTIYTAENVLAATGKQVNEHIDAAMALAFQLGEVVTQVAMKATYDKDYVAGEKVRAGGRAGHEAYHGNFEDRIRKEDEIRAAYETERAKGLNKMQSYVAVGKKVGTSERTVRRVINKIK